MDKKRKSFALACIISASAALALFVFAADEQSVRSGASPEPNRMSLKDLIENGSGKNKHVELSDFDFGKNFIYTAKTIQFKDVYLPLFVRGVPEDGSNLRLLLWIRNDRNSNLPLIEDRQTLNRFVMDFGQDPRHITGVLRKPMDSVKKLTSEAYPSVDTNSLQVLWARRFPDQESINILWCIWTAVLLVAGICALRLMAKP